jgi:hypothetical protein
VKIIIERQKDKCPAMFTYAVPGKKNALQIINLQGITYIKLVQVPSRPDQNVEGENSSF